MAEQSVLDIIFRLIKQGDGVKQASQEMKNLGTGAKDLTGITKMLTAGNILLGGALLGVGRAAADQLVRLVQLVPQLVLLGDQYSRSRDALEAYTGSAGAAQLAMISVSNAAGGAVDNLSASVNATKLFAMGLAETAQEADKLTRIAIGLGAAVGKDAKSSFEDFTLLLANQSILRLDQFGLSAAQVRARMDELMETNKNLTRDLAFQRAAMELGAEKLEKLDAAGFKATSNWQRLGAEVRNFGIFLGDAINEGVDPFLDRIFEATDRNRDLALSIFANTNNFTEYSAAMREAGLVGGFFTEGIGFTNEAMYEQAKAAEAAAAGLDTTSLAYKLVAVATEEAKFQLEGLHQLMSTDLVQDFEDMKQRVGDLNGDIREWQDRIAELESLSYLTEEQRTELDGLREKIAGAEEKVGDLEAAWERQSKQMVFKLIEQKLALDGFTQQEIDALARLAGPEGFGLIDQAQVAMINQVNNVTDATEVGTDAWITGLMGVASAATNAADELASIPPDKTVTITTVQRTVYESTYSSTNSNMINSIRSKQGGYLAHGGEFTVQGMPGPDRVPVEMHLTPGERVTVTPRGGLAPSDRAGSGGGNVTIQNVNINNKMDAVMLAALLRKR